MCLWDEAEDLETEQLARLSWVGPTSSQGPLVEKVGGAREADRGDVPTEAEARVAPPVRPEQAPQEAGCGPSTPECPSTTSSRESQVYAVHRQWEEQWKTLKKTIKRNI